MSLVRFLVVLAVGSLLSWAAWVMVLLSLDPVSGGFVVLALFYVSGSLALIGTLTLGGFFLRYWLERDKIPFEQISTALRQAAILTFATVIGLLLQAGRLLNIWSLVALIIITFVTEFFFLAGQSRRPQAS